MTHSIGYDYRDTTCGDCGVETNHQLSDSAEWYMVCRPIWQLANSVNPVHILCIGCLENRIGRQLVPADFSDVPLNILSGFERSERLRNRLGIDTK